METLTETLGKKEMAIQFDIAGLPVVQVKEEVN
jgi:hypothetical protein